MTEAVQHLHARRPFRALTLAGTLAILGLAVSARETLAANLSFRRGDVDGNKKLEMADALQTLGFLFLGKPASLGCLDAADTNDSGKIDLADGVYTLMFLFAGGPAPPPPGLGLEDCGPDTAAPDSLGCDVSPGCAVVPTPPSTPTGLVATAGNAQVALDWANNPEPDIAGYNVYRSTTAGSGHVKINGPLLPSSNYSDATVANGTRYYYRVSAVNNGVLESSLSAEVNARPTAPTAPSAPTSLVAIPGNAKVSLDWANNPEVNVTGYNVYRSTTQGSGHVKINGAPVVASAYTDTDSSLTNGTKYYYKVTALNSDLLESPSSAEVFATPTVPSTPDLRNIGHLLNRIAYGPTQEEIERIASIGLEVYIQEQLHPETVNESGNTALNTREAALFTTVTPTKDTILMPSNNSLRYLKGTAAPPADWRTTAFDDASWATGGFGIGYSDDDDATVLNDMQQNATQTGYMSVFVRSQFNVANPATISKLIFRADYDDGFVAYLNGTEIARRGFTGTTIPAFNAAANPAHESSNGNNAPQPPEDIDITSKKNLLTTGSNLLAIQVHNNAITSGDLSMIPVILSRETIPGQQPIQLIKGVGALQQLVHVRGTYSKRQLQAVLAEFLVNHFTWDQDKVRDILDTLRNSDASDALTTNQAASEAAQLAYEDYQFFYENALGNFGDLLLYSASSPSMNMYLDNYLNRKGVANENYAREILELYAFGVDNRYVQKDIEQLAKCFTGWTFAKVARESAQSFPASAETPPATAGVLYNDTVLIGLGAGWKYFKGTTEPTPNGVGGPTTGWAQLGFVETGWLNGSTGIGYGDADDATQLNDMQNSYRSVYLRRHFNLADPQALKNLILSVDYDDGFVVYLNGTEVARSGNLSGTPPANTQLTDEGHEVTEGTAEFNLNARRGLLVAGDNVLAIQVHNSALDSSDLSMLPRLIDREVLPGSIENGDLTGVWTFFFDANQHDTTAKTLFPGTPYQISVPAGRVGAAGLKDAIDIVKGMVNHPSTAEFICIKLIQKFVSDDISIQTKGTAPAPLRALLADCIAAWNSTTPKGNIEKVMEVILDPESFSSLFWDESSFSNKIRTPTEFNIASARVAGAALSANGLAGVTDNMAWPLFTRDEPNGNAEVGIKLLDTGTLRDRIDYVQALTENRAAEYTWPTLSYLDTRGLDTAQEIVDHFADLMFHGTLTAEDKGRLIEFLTTDNLYNPKPLVRANTTDFQTRVQELLGLMLSMPQWQYQ